ncbi:hypothetical protein EZS27_000727 [termite gut metagenome]|uniref:Uncharacterized protein n=1 Tax=termite gut metagenome TaxID=433724 RepID=A0A5J4T393_9ZZZZ
MKTRFIFQWVLVLVLGLSSSLATGLTVEVNNSTFTGNIAQQFGGVGHFVNTENSTGSTLNVTFNGCTFSGNKCGYEGGEGSGGVFSTRIQQTIGKINLSVNNSSCTGNTAKNGGVALLERASDDGENTQLNVTLMVVPLPAIKRPKVVAFSLPSVCMRSIYGRRKVQTALLKV